MINEIICGDALTTLSKMPDNTIGMVMTSPPYNVGKKYESSNDRYELELFLDWLLTILTAATNKLVPGGHMLINIANTGRNPYIHLSGLISNRLSTSSLMCSRGEIIWNKGYSASRTAWGSFRSANNPCLRDEHEYILVFRKNGTRTGESDISKKEFIEYTRSVWNVPPETKKWNHPCPFPVKLCKRAIRLYSFVDEIVLDPFVGIGSTCLAAKELNRRYIGIDISEKYCKIARERLAQESFL